MEQITELFKSIAKVIEGFQEVLKQHNKMFLDLYERVAKLEGKESEVK